MWTKGEKIEVEVGRFSDACLREGLGRRNFAFSGQVPGILLRVHADAESARTRVGRVGRAGWSGQGLRGAQGWGREDGVKAF